MTIATPLLATPRLEVWTGQPHLLVVYHTLVCIECAGPNCDALALDYIGMAGNTALTMALTEPRLTVRFATPLCTFFQVGNACFRWLLP